MKTICGIILACFLLSSFNGYAQERQFLFPNNIKDFLYQKILEKPNALFKAANSAQQSQNVSLVGRWATGPCYAVFVKDSIAYFGNGGYLEIVNVSNPSSPIELSKVLLPSAVFGVYVSGNYAYVASRLTGLRVIDVSNPTNPHEISHLDTGGETFAVCVTGNYAYLTTGGRLGVIDISTPSNPQVVGFYDMPGYAYKICVSGNYAYTANWRGGLRVIDISSPSNPHEVGFYNTYNAMSVYVSGSYAYVADDTSGLRIINVSIPTNPQQVGSFKTIGPAAGVFVSVSYAYIADGGNGLRVIDVSTPSNPNEVGSFDTPRGFAFGVYVSGNHAYVADDNEGLRIINISTPSNPHEVGFWDTRAITTSVHVSGNYAYIGDYTDGLRVIDISVPTNPQVVGLYTENGIDGGDVFVSGHYACMTDLYSGLRIIDINDQGSPQRVGLLNFGFGATGIYIRGNYAYVTSLYNNWLRIINIGTPTNPYEVGFCNTRGSAQDVFVIGNYAYIACGDYGLQIIDISNPSNPLETGFYSNAFIFANGVFVAGNYAYVSDADSNGLRIIDISTPTNPQQIGHYVAEGDAYGAYGIFVSGNYAFLAAAYRGLKVINVSSPSNPREVGFYRTGDQSRGVYVSGDYIYVADNYDGLYILKSELATDSLRVSIPDTNLIGQKSFPGDTITLPVFLNSLMYNQYNGIYSFQTTITYNDSLFQCIGYDSSGTVLSNYGGLAEFTVQFRKDSGRGASLDTLRIAGASDDSLYYPEVSGTPFAFPRPLIKIKFRIPTTAHNGDSTILHFTRFMFNEGTPGAATDDGSIKLKLRKKGDVDKNGVIQPIDAILVLRYVIHDTTLDAESQIAAEVSGNGEITAYDASLILQYFVGKITVFPTGTYYKQALPSNKSADIVMEWGEVKDGMISLLLKAKNLTDVYGYSLALSYDPSVLIYQGYQSSDLTKRMTAVVRNEGGQLRMAAAGVDPLNGEGEIVSFKFKLNSNGGINRDKLINLNELVLNEEIIISNATMSSLPKTYSLEQNYPNPFNPETRIRYQLLEMQNVQLIIYNLLGQPVRTLVNEMKPAGVYEVRWDGKNDQGISLASGVYIYRIKAGNFVSTRKLILMK